ncbi:hypothetical protein J6590_100961 [Homalodisca vitripennis]|nr:hypothetical protein J6590_100961 [Homalodisca vitripennis]
MSQDSCRTKNTSNNSATRTGDHHYRNTRNRHHYSTPPITNHHASDKPQHNISRNPFTVWLLQQPFYTTQEFLDWTGEHTFHTFINNNQESSSRERTAAFSLMMAPLSSTEHGSQTATPPPFSPVNLPGKHRTPMRSSIEGLNQEIERLVLKATSTLSTEREEEKMQMVHQATPEGHRAPLADLLRSTRSVNTQTPAFTSSSHSSALTSNAKKGAFASNILHSNDRMS